MELKSDRTIRSRRTKDPCLNCYLHKDRCICSCIPKLNLKTRVSLVIHHKELHRSTNTGRLAHHALVNSALLVRGENQKNTYQNLSHLIDPQYTNVLFYPAPNALELNQEFLEQYTNKPLHLIVPDGNWRQASKVHYRHQELSHIVRVKISTPNTASLHLRKESTQEGMATLEAIAHALGIIENEEVKKQLMNVYWNKLQQTFLGRGCKFSLDHIT
jgi:DTW domain-containing protein YfiP